MRSPVHHGQSLSGALTILDRYRSMTVGLASAGSSAADSCDQPADWSPEPLSFFVGLRKLHSGDAHRIVMVGTAGQFHTSVPGEGAAHRWRQLLLETLGRANRPAMLL
jgi:hypothetical protein